MTTALLLGLRWAVAGVLVVFGCRRALLLVASMLPPRRITPNATRSIAVLVAARNETRHLPRLLKALEQLDYPTSKLHVVLVSDGSVDDTSTLMREWTDVPFTVTVVTLPQSLGKGGALAAGLDRAPASDLVVVFDADCEPQPDVLQWLAGAFDDPSIGAATGYPRPANANAGRVARYAALERWCHHLVVLAGLDRLTLNPPVTGVAFAVRWAALQAAGGFPVGRLSEDLELSMALTAHGWRTRWIGSAVVREDVVETAHAFRQQRTRWSRGMLQSASRTQSLQELLTAAGYLDRAAVIAAVLLVPFGVVEAWWPALYLLLPLLTVLQAMRRAAARPAWRFLVALAGMVVTDVAVSLRSAAAQLLGTATRWEDRQS